MKNSDELGIVVVSLTGSCKFGSFGRKFLKGGGLQQPLEVNEFAQVPCHPTRVIQTSSFLSPEVVEWFSILATKEYQNQPQHVNNKLEDENFFFDFLLPYLKGRPIDTISHRKMIEHGAFGHARFGLHSLVVHGLGLPQTMYKRLMMFFQLCALRHLAGYFQNPNGFVASLPQPVIGCIFEFLPEDVKSVVAASRLWAYHVLPPCFGERRRLHLQNFAQSHPMHCHQMEGLYDCLLEGMQGIARKLSKMASRESRDGPSNHKFSCMVRSKLELLRKKTGGGFVEVVGFGAIMDGKG